MAARLNYVQAAPQVYQELIRAGEYAEKSGLELSIIRFVQIRASQINGCAYCLDMHTQDARAEGESEQRLYLLSAWREAPFYSERERAALEWTEALTLVADNHVPDEVYERVRPHFTDKELVDLTFVITIINSWNRLNVAFRTPAGIYHRKQTATHA
ncbi:MAG TPA: carboxymuconolactone decarboxylase [Ktedonobacter sp.]|nr:carboxymuconolactone decarboxylase [Ktedonobacter sp.]